MPLTPIITPSPRQSTFRVPNLALIIQRLIIQVDESVFLWPNWRSVLYYTGRAYRKGFLTKEWIRACLDRASRSTCFGETSFT